MIYFLGTSFDFNSLFASWDLINKICIKIIVESWFACKLKVINHILMQMAKGSKITRWLYILSYLADSDAIDFQRTDFELMLIF